MAGHFSSGDVELAACVFVVHGCVVKLLVQSPYLIVQLVHFGCFGVRLRCEVEVLTFLVLQLGRQLIDFLVLLLFCGIVVGEMSTGFLDAIVEESGLIGASVQVLLGPLDFDFTLVEH